MPVTIETDLRLDAAIGDSLSNPTNAKRLLEELKTNVQETVPDVNELLAYVTAWMTNASSEDRARFLANLLK